MAPSAVLMSKSAFLTTRTLLVVLEPLKQMRVDLKSANDFFKFALIQEIVLAYCSPFFSAISFKHSWPILPVVVNTKGVNVPYSTSRTLLEY